MATTAETEQRFELNSVASGQSRDEDVPLPEEASKWVVIAAASAVVFVGVGYTNAFGVFQDYFQTQFPEKDPSETILIGSVASSLYMILGAFAGRFADICGYQISLGIGSALMVGGLFAASVSNEFYQFFLSQGLTFGVGIAFAYLPAVSISRQYFSDLNHGLANGLVVSGGALGGCILPYIVRVLLERKGLSQTFRILAYIAVGVLCPSVFLLRPKTKPMTAKKRIFDLSLFHDRRFIAMVTACTIAMTGFLPRYFLITPSAIHMGVSSTYAAWLLGIMNGLSIVGRVGIGWFADRYGKVRALVSSFVLCGLGHILFWLPSVLCKDVRTVNALFTIFVVYTGLLGSGFVSLLPVVVSHLFGSSDLASKLGLLNSVVGLGVLAGPSAIYAIVSDKQDWSSGIITAGLLMVVGGIAMAGAFNRINRVERSNLRER